MGPKNRMRLTAEITIMVVIAISMKKNIHRNFQENCQKFAEHLFSKHHYHLDTQRKPDLINCSYKALDVWYESLMRVHFRLCVHWKSRDLTVSNSSFLILENKFLICSDVNHLRSNWSFSSRVTSLNKASIYVACNS